MQGPTRYCPKCGHANQAQFQFCASCSSPLPPVMAAPVPMVMSMPPPGYAWTPYGWQDVERQKQIDRTKTGVMLLMVGFALSWIPLVGIVGGFMVFIALFFVVLGRKAFGPAHARNVIVGVILWLSGVVLVIIITFLGALRLFGSGFGSPPTTADFVAFFDFVFYGAIIGAAISGLMTVLFGLGLSEKKGKVLLFAGYVSAIIISGLLFLLLRQSIVDMVQNVNQLTALNRLNSQTTLLSVGSVVSNTMYALAFYLIYNRIKRREIPAGGAQPPMAMPGYPGSMPMAAPGGPTMPSSQPPSMPPSSPPATPPGPGTGP